MEVAIKEKVRQMVSELLEVDVDSVQGDARFFEDLNADSLKALELVHIIEKEFRVSIPENQITELTSLNHTLRVLSEIT